MSNLNNLLQLLLKSEIEFVLIGGYAATLHGSTQLTQDIDICALLNHENIERLRKALKEVHPKHRMNPSFQPSLFDYPNKDLKLSNMYLITDLGVVDILEEVKPIGRYEILKDNAVTVEIFGHDCKVISLEDLLKVKRTMTREKDKSTVLQLEAILRSRKRPDTF